MTGGMIAVDKQFMVRVQVRTCGEVTLTPHSSRTKNQHYYPHQNIFSPAALATCPSPPPSPHSSVRLWKSPIPTIAGSANIAHVRDPRGGSRQRSSFRGCRLCRRDTCVCAITAIATATVVPSIGLLFTFGGDAPPFTPMVGGR